MRNWLKAAMLLIAVAAMMATPALAAEYEFDDSDGPMYAPSTSVDQVIVVGGGATESSNIDRSKNTAVFAPPFGSPESYLPGAGTTLIPQASTSTGSTISGETIYLPPASYDDSTPAQDTSLSSNKFTLPDGLFYEDGSLGRLKIPSLGLSVRVIERAGLPRPGKSSCFFCPSMKKKEIQALWENYPDLFERAIALEHGSAETNTSVKGLGRDWSWESYYNEFMANKEFEEAQLTFDQLFPDSPGGCICGAPCGCYDG